MTLNRNTEIFADAGEEKIAGLLGNLPSVNAPSDFDFRVRARIANGSPKLRPSWTYRLAQVAVPAVLLVGVGGYFGTGMFRQPSAPQTIQAGLAPDRPSTEPRPAVADSSVSEPPVPSRTEVAENLVKPPPSTTNPVTPANRKVQTPPKPMASDDPSFVESANRERSLNISAWKKMADAGVKISNNRVVAAPANSGFQAGDQILDMSASSVTVRRDGKTVQIALK